MAIQVSTDRREAKVFRAHAAPHGVCDNLINALKVLANQQEDGDSVGELVKNMESKKVVMPKFTTQ